ncbi:hemerythrin domain-containing protein [Thauera sp. JM12B12]|uniref:hemerythrin domain-containing protein n=1 Tax=Thauera sp. JM12B12 TaxID=3142262 RepID=UPI0031F3910F
MPSLTWNASLANDLAPMDATHREFIECYNAAAAAAPEAFLPAFDRLIEHTQAHFDLENGWMAAVDFPGCHRAEHDRVLAVMLDIRKRVERGDRFLARRLIEELPAWFENHVNGMDAALAFHLASIGFDVESASLRPLADGEQRGAGCGCASMNAPEPATGSSDAEPVAQPAA